MASKEDQGSARSVPRASSNGRTEAAPSASFDTSGEVLVQRATSGGPFAVRWSDLDPFTQGYVEALFESASAALQWERQRRHSEVAQCPEGERFSDLAPEALATILDRCAAYEREARAVGLWGGNRTQGEWFWKYQQKPTRGFPLNALAAYLGGDGRVHLRETGQ